MKQTLNHILYPGRELAARFVKIKVVTPVNTDNTIVNKAANFIALAKVEGDYLEFGVFAGSSFIDSYHIIKDVFGWRGEVSPGCREEDAVEV